MRHKTRDAIGICYDGPDEECKVYGLWWYPHVASWRVIAASQISTTAKNHAIDTQNLLLSTEAGEPLSTKFWREDIIEKQRHLTAGGECQAPAIPFQHPEKIGIERNATLVRLIEAPAMATEAAGMAAVPAVPLRIQERIDRAPVEVYNGKRKHQGQAQRQAERRSSHDPHRTHEKSPNTTDETKTTRWSKWRFRSRQSIPPWRHPKDRSGLGYEGTPPAATYTVTTPAGPHPCGSPEPPGLNGPQHAAHTQPQEPTPEEGYALNPHANANARSLVAAISS
ncbi:hypothetical protein CYMTET_42597 [Cymbomonas tetramitiformis]|uniref:Uncharacterized protein n=1 Tax=Cymbomonas tetramitiformis TaxID=36881 RepID=A0AAE0C3R2_9CHLO|nr:hypothetical protein CYMTET_42597 [Cymbomonas tetramitiformis]